MQTPASDRSLHALLVDHYTFLGPDLKQEGLLLRLSDALIFFLQEFLIGYLELNRTKFLLVIRNECALDVVQTNFCIKWQRVGDFATKLVWVLTLHILNAVVLV